MDRRELPCSKLGVGDQSFLGCFTLGVSFYFVVTVSPLNFHSDRLKGNSRPKTRIKTLKTLPQSGFTPLLLGTLRCHCFFFNIFKVILCAIKLVARSSLLRTFNLSTSREI